MRSGRRVTSGPLLLSATPRASDAPAQPLSVGVTIGRRVAPRAVDRNRVKRLLRQAMRSYLIENDTGRLHGVEAVVLIWRQRPAAPGLLRLIEVRYHVDMALTKVLTQLGMPL